jgi:hypothetical protein
MKPFGKKRKRIMKNKTTVVIHKSTRNITRSSGGTTFGNVWYQVLQNDGPGLGVTAMFGEYSTFKAARKAASEARKLLAGS